MSTFLYRFGYETPRQSRTNEHGGWDDEDSQVVLIDAETEEAALRWGQEISERFIKLLFNDEKVSWKESGYATEVERCSSNLQGMHHVNYGEYPDFTEWLSKA